MKNKTILIVDDDAKIARMFKRRLKKLACEIHVADNGQIGLDMALKLNPDLIIMDIQMPVMDGYTLVRTLRAKNYKGLITACTASVRAQDTEQTYEAGCDFFIAKPIDLQFEKTIEDLLNGNIRELRNS